MVASFPLPKALWLSRKRPTEYERSVWLLSCAEWMVFRLTGCAHTAIGAKGFDRFYWSRKALSALGLDPSRFPPFAVAGAEIGRVTVQAADTFGIAAGVVVDPHVSRLSQRLGLSRNNEPVQIERDLMTLVDQNAWIFLAMGFILHARRDCDARKPACDLCTLNDICPSSSTPNRPVDSPSAGEPA